MTLFRAFPISTLTALMPCSFPFLRSEWLWVTGGTATARQLLCGVSSGSHPTPPWSSRGTEPMSRVRWGNLTTVMTVEREEGGGEGKREGGRSLGAVYRDVVPPIVLSVWLSLMVRLFASPMPLMSLHQSCSQTFDPQFKAALVKICMLIARLPNSCLKSQIMLHQGRTSHPSNWDPVDSLCRDEMLVSSVGNPLIFTGSDELKRKSITFSKGCSSWMKVWLNSGRGALPLT